MTQSLDINGMLITSSGDSIPCKLVNISDKGYLEIFTLDSVAEGERYQLIINAPRIRTGVTITAVVNLGDSFHCEALAEEATPNIKAKIIEQKVRGLIK